MAEDIKTVAGIKAIELTTYIIALVATLLGATYLIGGTFVDLFGFLA